MYVVDCSPEADNLCLPEPFSIRSHYVLCSEKAQAQTTTDGETADCDVEVASSGHVLQAHWSDVLLRLLYCYVSAV